jgi:hypothetical protein
MGFFDGDEDTKDYGYWDFIHALKKLPDEVSTAAYTEWLYAFLRDNKEKKQAIYNKYVGWSKKRSWEKKPWEKPVQKIWEF